MKIRPRNLVAATAALACAAALLTISADSVQARTKVAAPRRAAIKVVKNARVITRPGAKRIAVPPTAKLALPATLTKASKILELRELGVSAEPGSVYARVDAFKPSAPLKATLVLVGPKLVDPGTPKILFSGKMAKHAPVLWVKSAKKGARYLIDCAIAHQTAPEGGEFIVYENGAKLFTAVPKSQDNLTWVMDSPDDGWHGYKFGPASGPASGYPWLLHSCEVTNL